MATGTDAARRREDAGVRGDGGRVGVGCRGDEDVGVVLQGAARRESVPLYAAFRRRRVFCGVVVIEDHDQGLAAGQFAVFYDRRVCIGCGVILEQPMREGLAERDAAHRTFVDAEVV